MLKSFKDLLRKAPTITQLSGVYLQQSETVVTVKAKKSVKILFFY